MYELMLFLAASFPVINTCFESLWLTKNKPYVSAFIRMPVENQEERTVEVLGLSERVNEESLFLYFENKRYSGGGPLVSVEKQGVRALLVFEEAEGKWHSMVITS